MTCPQCGADVERVRAEDGGCIEEPVIDRHMQLRRKVRPASYWACTGCEWCSETAGLRVLSDEDAANQRPGAERWPGQEREP